MPSTTDTPRGGRRRTPPAVEAARASHPSAQGRPLATVPGNSHATLADQTEYLRVLYYGNPGYTKTTCAATMASLGRVIYIDAEKRLNPTPLQRISDKLGLDIPIGNIEPRRDISYNALIELTEEIRDRQAEGEQIVGVVWDSISEQHRELLMQSVDDSILRAQAKGEWRHPTRLFQEDYGDMTEQMRRVLRRFRDLPLHLAVTALPRSDVVNGVQYTTAGLTPAVLRDVQGMMDFIIAMRYEAFDDEDEYSGICRPTGPFDAKDTFGVLPPRLVDPTFMRILAYTKGELDAKTDPLQVAARDRRLAISEADKAAAHTAIKEGTD